MRLGIEPRMEPTLQKERCDNCRAVLDPHEAIYVDDDEVYCYDCALYKLELWMDEIDTLLLVMNESNKIKAWRDVARISTKIRELTNKIEEVASELP